MAFESNNFNVVKKEKLPKSEFSVECNIAGSMAKVLAVATTASVTNSEVLNGVINYSGNVDVKLVYLNEEGEIGTLNSTCPFTSKFEGENILTGQKAQTRVKVIDNQIENLGNDDVRVLVNIEQSGVLIESQEVHSIATQESDVCSKTEEIEVVRFVGQQSETFEVTSEFGIREPIKKVILTESQAYVKSCESGANFISVSGEVVTRILYLSEEDKFETGYVYEPFKEEVELEGATRESQTEAHVFVKCDSVKTEIQESDKGNKLVVTTPILVTVKAYEKANVTVIKDLYSTCCEIKVDTESFDMSVVCPTEIVEGKIEGTLTLDDEKPRVDKILFVGGNNVVVSNAYIKDGEINVEGIASTNVVYLNDETNSLNSVLIEVPFVITDKFNNENIEGILDVDAVVCDVDVVVKKGRELFYDAKIKATVNYCHPVVSGVITNAEKLEDYAERDYGLELLFAHAGQEAWDIAKEARVNEEQLILQNPDVLFPLQEDKNLVLFYQKTK